MNHRGTDYNYTDFYNRITYGIRRRPKGVQYLRAADHLLTGVIFLFYPLMLAALILCGIHTGKSLTAAVQGILPLVLVPGISFAVLSVIRRGINEKRPYEDWPIEPLIPKNKKGSSMPSRHVFSAAIIAMCGLRVNAVIGGIGLILTVLVAAIRVLGGVHYPKDVAVGYLVGVAAGAFLFL